MKSLPILAAFGLAAIPAAAAPPTKPAADARTAADRFNLELAPADDGAAAAPAEPATDAPGQSFTLDTPIETLIANRRAKAVLDRDLPGLSSDKNLAQIRQLTLRRLAPLSGGRLSPTLLEKVGRDLAAID